MLFKCPILERKEMAGLQTSIQLQDRMSAVLNNITSSMSIMLSTFEQAQAATDAGLNAASMDAAKQGIAEASAEMARYREEVERVAATPSPAPQEPAWKSTAASAVFMNSGADRFQAEYQAADQMARQLYESQKAISAQARSMRVTPPGMLNDVVATENRMQALSQRIQQLNSIPVNLRTDQTNNELESLRGKLSQAVSVQEALNQAMGRMDISAANAAYQQLNSVMDSAERNIRDNLNVQNQFNNSIRDGTSAASGLWSKLKGVAAGAGIAFSAQKVITLSDSVTQTTARLNLMNDGLQSTEQLNQMIFASAQRARAPYMDTASAIAKMGLNAGNAFSSNKDLIAFMEQVNKQFVIGGATAQEQSNAMVQLSQAMAAGALRGEELNSILDAAPGIARTIEKNMGWAEGSIKKYAEKGAVSAQVVKASLLNMADETNAKFNSMPMTFSQVMTSIQTTLLQTFYPVIQAIGQGATFINNNWSSIAPIFYGLATGILVAAAAWGVYKAVTWLSVAANQALLASMLSNPFLWIAIVIGIIVAAIYKWVQSVGGIRVAWLICVNAVLTQADKLKLGFMMAWMNIQNGIDNMLYGFEAFKVGVQNAIGNMKIKVLNTLQSLVNGAIDRINKLINVANSVGGLSIQLIDHVEFAADAAIEEQIKQRQRAADLAAQKDANAAAKAGRKNDYDRAVRAADDARMQRQAGIEGAKADAARRAAEDDGAAGAIAGNTEKTAGNTARMADTMDALDEEIKYMRDAAEQEVINRFTLAELKIDMTNNNTLKTETDFDRMNGMLNDLTDEILSTAAEGGHL
ncbi:tape measure domain-containing protein [[Clostridium] celerecrescens 18A]|uniref:Tape measure domain-containing protein n=2 Tax=Lacrimispora celerecrescens TaxID=29354 RepID=A0A2M8ZAR9_9FIRM|nr:tape measure domain-containing protein [[Clostridium] celerecrescens 18A]